MGIRFAREGITLAFFIAAIGAALLFAWRPAGIVVLIMSVLVLAFFRDPERVAPPGAGNFVSAADGVVVSVDDMDEQSFIGGPAKRVAVFLSVFDVHINRLPATGKVVYKEYIAGGHKSALRADSAKLNERNHIGIETPGGRVLVCQIAGLLARRVVCRVGIGDPVERGERFGLIMFGSRVEIYLPPDVRVTVAPGDRVRAGESIIAVKDKWPTGGPEVDR